MTNIQRRPSRRYTAMLAGLTLTLACRIASAEDPPPNSETSELRFDRTSGELTANIVDTSLGDVLQSLRATTGLEYRCNDLAIAQRSVSVIVEHLPVLDGLKRILKGQAFAIESEHGRPLKLTILSSATAIQDRSLTAVQSNAEPSLEELSAALAEQVEAAHSDSDPMH